MMKPPIGALDKPKKSNTPIIIAAVVGVLGVMGCIIAVAAAFMLGG